VLLVIQVPVPVPIVLTVTPVPVHNLLLRLLGAQVRNHTGAGTKPQSFLKVLEKLEFSSQMISFYQLPPLASSMFDQHCGTESESFCSNRIRRENKNFD
jgi:hypothetical protein